MIVLRNITASVCKPAHLLQLEVSVAVTAPVGCVLASAQYGDWVVLERQDQIEQPAQAAAVSCRPENSHKLRAGGR